ncbi:MAG: helix-turn-helix domain-containing protein [Phycisphaeraceae bacterium]|nr:helix-turn-helix domain-containing protein [Phycisphaeraceae bacterium]
MGTSGRSPRSRRVSKTGADAVFTIDDLVAYLKLPKSTVYKLAQERKIPGQKVGRHWRFRKETIDRWLDSTASPRSGPAPSA